MTLAAVTSPRPVGRAHGSGGLLQPGWPLTFTFAGFPLWWLLGISNFIGHIAALLLLLELLRRRRIRAPRSMGMWFLFLAWVAVGALVLRVDAPFAASADSMGTYITWAYRFGWYISATIFMVYIGTMREELSSQRITRSLSMFFITIVAGGWLAVVSPGLEFPSVLEAVLPRGIAQVDFVQFLIHPTVVQDYAESVAGHARPSAPFAYANFWGLNFACALPFFVIDWFGPKSHGRRRAVGVIILLLAAVPMILSWNRGLWVAVLAMVALVALRSAIRGHVKTLVILVATTVVLVATILISPLGDVIQSRIDNPTSNSTREQLAELTADSVLSGSPIIGFGSTRNAAASFYSIAGGDRPNCPECSPPAMGTQGQFWLVLFAQGVIGIVLFYGFLLIWFVRGLRLHGATATAAICAVLAHLVTMTVYDSLGIGTVVLLVAIGLIWRQYDEQYPPGPLTGGVYTIGGYLQLVRQNLALIIAFALVGAGVGGGVQLASGNPVIARTSVIVPAESVSEQPGFTTSLDTLNQLARSGTVRAAIRDATGGEEGPLDVVATPNSRILTLSYTGDSTGTALAGVTAAAEGLLSAHRSLLEADRDSAVSRLDDEYAALLRALAIVDSSLKSRLSALDVSMLQQTRGRILSESADVANESARLGALVFEVGRTVRPAAARTTYDPLVVSVATGLMLGMLAGVLTARLRDMHTRRLRGVRGAAAALGTDMLARIPAAGARRAANHGWSPDHDGEVPALEELMQRSGVVAVVPGDPVGLTRRLSTRLDSNLIARSTAESGRLQSSRGATESSPQIVVVASENARFGALTWRLIRHRRNGLSIAGLIVITGPTVTGPSLWRRARLRGRARAERGAPRGTTAH